MTIFGVGARVRVPARSGSGLVDAMGRSIATGKKGVSGVIRTAASGRVIALGTQGGAAGPVWRGNEPAGMTFLAQRPNDAAGEDPMWDDFDNGTFAYVSDPTAPRSPPMVAEAFYAGGSNPNGTGRGMSEVYNFGTNWRELYACYWTKYSSNYFGNSSGNNKNSFVYSNAFVASLVFENICAGNGTMTPMFVGQDTVVPNSPEYEGWTPNVVPGAQFVRGQWHLVELHVVGNTAGAADGLIRWWLDGVKIGEYTGLQFNNAATFWTQFNLTSVYGGGSSVVPADQYLRFDDAYLSVKH